MVGHILGGTALAQKIKENVKNEIGILKQKNIIPCLSVILIGNNPASAIYVGRKEKACEEVGITSKKNLFPESVSQKELMETISKLNNDKNVHGILVQLPLPAHMNENEVMQCVSPEKDIDGFHGENQAKLYSGREGLFPNTPNGIIRLIESSGEKIEGKHAVVIGRSLIVGKPTAHLLLQKNATVTICHSKTKNLSNITKNADILVAAIGKPKMITREMVKPGAIVIDVGISRSAEGKVVGDVDFENVKEVVGWITPVPGGVGPMTVACLMENTLRACQNQTLKTDEKEFSRMERKPLCIGVIGSTKGTDMQAIIDAIEKKELNARIGFVASDKSDAFILERARKHGINFGGFDMKSFPSKMDFENAIAQKMKENDVELIFLIGYKKIVAETLLNAFPNRILNIHPSLMPAFIGKFDVDVHSDVLNYGAKVSGATLHIVTADVDAGPIVMQKAVEIENNETPDSLKEKVQKAEQEIIVNAVRAYAGNKVKVDGRKVWIEK